MRRLFFLLLTAAAVTCPAQTAFTINGQSTVSSSHCLYVNDALTTDVARYTFRTVNEALLFAEQQNGRDTLWTDICIEPSVYWIDDPDDPTVRVPARPGEAPYGLDLRLDHVRLIGLSDDAADVVLASQRGQTQGADGNFTMLHITGSDIEARNITFGNYCNVDLVYPRNPALNRPKRNAAIVQAQLVICRGDRYAITNCRFISRLNLCPFVGPSHVDFDHCYFECTDDALCGTGTYRHCGFTFYGSKPFYSTSGAEGARFIDCDLHSTVHGRQYLTKASGPVVMEDCRWTSDDAALIIAWTPDPDPKHYCNMIRCTLNGQPYELGPTPDVPMPVAPMALQLQPTASAPVAGAWTVDAYKPSDVQQYDWGNQYRDAHASADGSYSAPWCFGEGLDGARGCFGLFPNVRGARMMYTGRDGEEYHNQTLSLSLDPCKEHGQGFGSATGQYLDVCIKFDTRTLTGYGLRFVRTPNHDNAVDVYLVAYADGQISAISEAQTCYLFKRGCRLTLSAQDGVLSAVISNGEDSQTLTAQMPRPNLFGGIHLQHTGTLGPSGVVISSIHCNY